jgi:hypothetical protein
VLSMVTSALRLGSDKHGAHPFVIGRVFITLPTQAVYHGGQRQMFCCAAEVKNVSHWKTTSDIVSDRRQLNGECR